jgi:septum formation protein
MKHIILASSSTYRKDILLKTGIDFEVIPSKYEENNDLDLTPDKLVEHLALGKASDVAGRYPGSVVIGADTIVYFDGRVIGKPKSREEQISNLRAFSGKFHSAYTGLVIIEGNHVVVDSLETKIYFRELSDEEIDRYVYQDKRRDNAGGYAIQGKGALFVTGIEGDYYNAIGLPLNLLGVRLKEFGIEFL